MDEKQEETLSEATNVIQLENDQIERIIKRYNPKFPQQKSNMKKKLRTAKLKTEFTLLLYKEINYLNSKIEEQNKLLNMNKGEFITYRM